MENYRVMTKTQLREANDWAIEIGYNRAFDPKPLQEFLEGADEDIRFPIVLSITHGYAAGIPVDPHIRCKVILDGEGASGFIDVDKDLFNSLERIEKPEEG